MDTPGSDHTQGSPGPAVLQAVLLVPVGPLGLQIADPRNTEFWPTGMNHWEKQN